MLFIFRFDDFILIRQAILLTIDTFGFSLLLPIFGLPFLVTHQYPSVQSNQRKPFIFARLSQVGLFPGYVSIIFLKWFFSNSIKLGDAKRQCVFFCVSGIYDLWTYYSNYSYVHNHMCHNSKTAFDGNRNPLPYIFIPSYHSLNIRQANENSYYLISLQVWGLFAPKFVFDVVGLILSDFVIVLVSLYYFGWVEDDKMIDYSLNMNIRAHSRRFFVFFFFSRKNFVGCSFAKLQGRKSSVMFHEFFGQYHWAHAISYLVLKVTNIWSVFSLLFLGKSPMKYFSNKYFK